MKVSELNKEVIKTIKQVVYARNIIYSSSRDHTCIEVSTDIYSSIEITGHCAIEIAVCLKSILGVTVNYYVINNNSVKITLLK